MEIQVLSNRTPFPGICVFSRSFRVAFPPPWTPPPLSPIGIKPANPPAPRNNWVFIVAFSGCFFFPGIGGVGPLNSHDTLDLK